MTCRVKHQMSTLKISRQRLTARRWLPFLGLVYLVGSCEAQAYKARIAPNSCVASPCQLTAGRLDVSFFTGGTWYSVCDNGFTDVDAAAACRGMGYTGGTVLGANSVLDGTNAMGMDNVVCNGNDNSIFQCDFDTTRGANCASRGQEVGVQCTSTPMLRMAPNSCSISSGCVNAGRLEVSFNAGGTWYAVCKTDFSNVDAAVACRTMGYGGGTVLSATSVSDLTDIFDNRYVFGMADVACTGSESSIFDCGRRQLFYDYSYCAMYSGNEVGVQCTYASPPPPSPPPPSPPPPSLPPPSSPIGSGDCKCACCKGNGCTPATVGYFDARGYSPNCSANECRAMFSSQCPASEASGQVSATFTPHSAAPASRSRFLSLIACLATYLLL